MEDLELLIREIHKRNMKIILDIALNHTSSEVSLDQLQTIDQP